MINEKKILIATGIYPPSIGGPAQYAYELEKVWKSAGYKVTVKYFGKIEKVLPSGIRHIYFLIKSVWSFLNANKIFVLDTWSAALPIATLCFFTRKKFIIRTGGDFLWESYLERTKKKILFSNFYKDEVKNLNKKEKIVFIFTKWILKRAEKIVFSTAWQRDVWIEAYNFSKEKTLIIENFYGKFLNPIQITNKIFLASTRHLFWKNIDALKDVFEDENIKKTGFILDTKIYNHQDFLFHISNAYAVILVSLGDISPNMILDAIRYGKPFIVTREIGIYDRIKNIALFADPLNKNDIKEKVLWLSNSENYQIQKNKIRSFSFTHSWEEIAEKFLKI